MSTRLLAPPNLPYPPDEYDPQYMADLIRAYEQAIALIVNPGEARATKIVLTDLKTDDVDSEPGTLYKDGNTIKVSVLNIAAVRGANGTGNVGTVTVSIS